MTVVNSAPSADPAPSRGRRAGALTGISLGYFMVLLDTTVLSVAEPDLASSLGSRRPDCSGRSPATPWCSRPCCCRRARQPTGSAPSGSSGAVSRCSRSPPCLSAAAPGLGVLLLLRAVSGAAAAACVPASMAMIARLYPEPAAGRGRSRCGPRSAVRPSRPVPSPAERWSGQRDGERCSWSTCPSHWPCWH
ncbi:hypothetical protein LT493_30220 [Streptomyces tricolor]|nr:hypothetical protein [Streptomyces tricolor]